VTTSATSNYALTKIS